MANVLIRDSLTGRISEQPSYYTASGSITFSTPPSSDSTAFVTVAATWAKTDMVITVVPDPSGVGHGHSLDEFIVENISLSVYAIADGVSVTVMGYAPTGTTGSYDIRLIGFS